MRGMPVMLSAGGGVRLAGAREGRRAPVSLSHHLPEIHKIKRCIMGKVGRGPSGALQTPLSVFTTVTARVRTNQEPEKGDNVESETVFGGKYHLDLVLFALLSSSRAASSP